MGHVLNETGKQVHKKAKKRCEFQKYVSIFENNFKVINIIR